MSIQELLEKNDETKSWITDFDLENFKRPLKLSYDLIDAKSNKKVLAKGRTRFKKCT